MSALTGGRESKFAGGLDKIPKGFCQGRPGASGGLLEGLCGVESRAVEEFVSGGNFGSFRLGDSCAAKANDVDAGEQVFATANGVRGNGFTPSGSAANHGEVPDAHELVEDDVAADDDAIAKFGVACEEDVVGKDAVIADGAIVADVNANHKEIVVADGGYGIFFRAAVNGDVFADDVAGADARVAGGSGFVSKVLGFAAQVSSEADATARTNR